MLASNFLRSSINMCNQMTSLKMINEILRNIVIPRVLINTTWGSLYDIIHKIFPGENESIYMYLYQTKKMFTLHLFCIRCQWAVSVYNSNRIDTHDLIKSQETENEIMRQGVVAVQQSGANPYSSIVSRRPSHQRNFNRIRISMKLCNDLAHNIFSR